MSEDVLWTEHLPGSWRACGTAGQAVLCGLGAPLETQRATKSLEKRVSISQGKRGSEFPRPVSFSLSLTLGYLLTYIIQGMICEPLQGVFAGLPFSLRAAVKEKVLPQEINFPSIKISYSYGLNCVIPKIHSLKY